MSLTLSIYLHTNSHLHIPYDCTRLQRSLLLLPPLSFSVLYSFLPSRYVACTYLPLSVFRHYFKHCKPKYLCCFVTFSDFFSPTPPYTPLSPPPPPRSPTHPPVTLTNIQVALKGIETSGYVVASSSKAQIFGQEHQPVLKEGDLVAKKSWLTCVGKLQVSCVVHTF